MEDALARRPPFTLLRIEDVLAQENCYVLLHDETLRALLIDPGYQASTVVSVLATIGASAAAVALTHCHPDHCFGVPTIARGYDADLYLHSADLPVLGFDWSSKGFPWRVTDTLGPYNDLASVTSISFAGEEVGVMPTPGHTPGSVTFSWRDWIFTGDTLFRRGIGNTIAPFGDAQILDASLATIISSFPLDASVFSGHGEPTTIGEEASGNPFLADGHHEA